MRTKDTSNALISMLAVFADAWAIWGGFILATAIRFNSGLPVPKGIPPNLWPLYLTGAGVATLLFLFIFGALDLYVRPQIGSFPNKIPRIIRGTAIGILFSAALAFATKTTPPFSTAVVGIAFLTVSLLVLIERYVLFRIEWNLARHSRRRSNVLILGTDSVAAHVKRTLSKEPMLRAQVAGFLRTDLAEPSFDVPQAEIKGTVDQLAEFLRKDDIDQVILTNSELGHDRIMEMIFLCERSLTTFNMVPDLFRIMTTSMDVQSLDDIPLLGVSRWPLDFFWNRLLKRASDIVGSLIGLIIASPVIAIASVFVKRSSPGPIFYSQERCGEDGKPFHLYKLRTMHVNAEAESGPVWTTEADPRRTRTGTFLRKSNLDELPQLWNVLKGDMSLIGPRPERPHFVEQFKDDVLHYMSRHVSKPGITGWAQINGLRGNTSIEDRIKYDLYYLENWSLAFDLKILLRTLFSHENAY